MLDLKQHDIFRLRNRVLIRQNMSDIQRSGSERLIHRAIILAQSLNFQFQPRINRYCGDFQTRHFQIRGPAA